MWKRSPDRLDHRQLSVPLYTNPLSEQDDRVVERALASPLAVTSSTKWTHRSWRMCSNLNDCDRSAGNAGNKIEPICKLYMALWINMTGPPTTLKKWVSGNEIWLDHHRNRIPPPTGQVTEPMIVNYLKSTDFFVANPQNFNHMQEAVSAGAGYL